MQQRILFKVNGSVVTLSLHRYSSSLRVYCSLCFLPYLKAKGTVTSSPREVKSVLLHGRGRRDGPGCAEHHGRALRHLIEGFYPKEGRGNSVYCDGVMKKRAKRSRVKGLLIGGGVIAAVVQGGMLLFVGDGEESAEDPRKVIERATEGIKDPGQRAQRRIVMAANQFKSKRGRLPNRLEELVPEWFDVVPVDPATKKAFAYRVEGDKPVVGAPKGSSAVGDGAIPESLTEAQIDEIIASLDAPDPAADYVYDPTDRRDPFKPFDFSVKVSVDTSVPPLQRFSLGQLKVSAILLGGDDPSAMVETEEGMGYPVKKGTKIGLDNGEVIEIVRDKVLIRERFTDFTGAVTKRTVEMMLHGDTKKNGFSRPAVKQPTGGKR